MLVPSDNASLGLLSKAEIVQGYLYSPRIQGMNIFLQITALFHMQMVN